MLRIRDINPGSRIRIFFQYGSRVKNILSSRIHSASNNLSILTQKIVPKFSEIWYGMFIPDPDLDYSPIPDPGVKKVPDSGSATLYSNHGAGFDTYLNSYLLEWSGESCWNFTQLKKRCYCVKKCIFFFLLMKSSYRNFFKSFKLLKIVHIVYNLP